MLLDRNCRLQRVFVTFRVCPKSELNRITPLSVFYSDTGRHILPADSLPCSHNLDVEADKIFQSLMFQFIFKLVFKFRLNIRDKSNGFSLPHSAIDSVPAEKILL
jgi:hypothetical protein